MRWVGHLGRVGEKRDAYRALAGKLWEKTPLERPRHRRNDNMDLQNVGWGAWTGISGSE
jgi:hypothetical protein